MNKNVINKRVNSFFVDLLLTISVPVALFISTTEKSCEQGDWLTCSGNITYSTTHYLLLGYAYAILLLNIIILPLFFSNSIGKLIFGLKVASSSNASNPKLWFRLLRTVLNLILIPFYALIFPFSLIEIILIRTGKIDQRIIDKLLGLNIVSRNNTSQ